MLALSSLDEHLLSPAYVDNPYEAYDLLRTKAPVFWSERWNAWLVTRYDDVKRVLQDHSTFSNQGRYTLYLSSLSAWQRDELAYLIEHYEHGGLVQSDPPDHTRLRRLVNLAFTPRAVRQMRDQVTAIVDDLLDGLAEKQRVEGQIDLVQDFAFPLPAIVIAGMLGVPLEERDQFKEWSSNIQRFLGSGEVHFPYALEAQRCWQKMNDYFAELAAQRRSAPRDDLVSALVTAQDEGETLSEDELVRTCGAMLIAGHETTTNLIASGVLRMLEFPKQRRLLEQDPSLYPQAVEEFLRFDTPFQSVPRTVTGSVTLADQTLRPDDLVQVMVGAANRDPARFPRPGTLKIQRVENKHVAFGHGIHFCLGAPLARLEAPIALEQLWRRFPGLTTFPDNPPRWKKSMVQRGLETLPLRLF